MTMIFSKFCILYRFLKLFDNRNHCISCLFCLGFGPPSLGIVGLGNHLFKVGKLNFTGPKGKARTHCDVCDANFAVRVKLRRHIRSGPLKLAPATCFYIFGISCETMRLSLLEVEKTY